MIKDNIKINGIKIIIWKAFLYKY